MDNKLLLYFFEDEMAPSGNIFLAQRLVDLIEDGYCVKITVDKFEVSEIPKELL